MSWRASFGLCDVITYAVRRMLQFQSKHSFFFLFFHFRWSAGDCDNAGWLAAQIRVSSLPSYHVLALYLVVVPPCIRLWQLHYNLVDWLSDWLGSLVINLLRPSDWRLFYVKVSRTFASRFVLCYFSLVVFLIVWDSAFLFFSRDLVCVTLRYRFSCFYGCVLFIILSIYNNDYLSPP